MRDRVPQSILMQANPYKTITVINIRKCVNTIWKILHPEELHAYSTEKTTDTGFRRTTLRYFAGFEHTTIA